MKLDADLVRSVMLYLEKQEYFFENSEGAIENNPVSFADLCVHFPKSSKADIFYVLKNLDEASYIDFEAPCYDNAVYNCYISSITFLGHEFLSSIQHPDNWSIVKRCLSSVKNYSLSAISSIAQGATAAAINAFFSLNR